MRKISRPIATGVALLLSSLLAQPGHAYTIQKLNPGEGQIQSPYLLTCNDGSQFGVGLDNHGRPVSTDAVAAVSKEVCKTHGGLTKAPSKDGKPGWNRGLPAMVLVADEPMRANGLRETLTSAVLIAYPTCPAGWTLVANPGADTCTAPVPVPQCPAGKKLVTDKDMDGKRDVCQ